MRILFALPHYYYNEGDIRYGSLSGDPRLRRQLLFLAVLRLHQTFGSKQGSLNILQKKVTPVNQDMCLHDIEVVICTTGDRHLVDSLNLPPDYFTHHNTQADPRFLGYECQAVLQERLGGFDYYCYMEDDLALMDNLFFNKLRWFNSNAGDECLLLPNRFELSPGLPCHKLYLDGDVNPAKSAPFQDINDRPQLIASFLEQRLAFHRPINPHAGCFFLNEAQMRTWVSRPDFLERSDAFISPLESAATLGIMRTFRLYKPGPQNAGFLELEHMHRRFIGQINPDGSLPL